MLHIMNKNGKKIVETSIGELLWVRPSTVNGARMIRSYENASYYSLDEVYKRPSEYKVEAWEDCERRCEAMGGYGLTITGYSCHTFSAAFKCKINSEDEGEVIIYITKDHLYCIPVYKEKRY